MGWTHPLTKRIVPLDDPGMELVMPKAVLRFMKEKEEKDVRHSGVNVTVTAPLGCARQLFLSRALPTNPNPQVMWPMTGGTMLHQFLGEIVTNGEWYSEENYPEKCEFEGVIGEVKMGCKVDLIKRDYSAIWDFKTSFKNADKWVAADRTAKEGHQVQLNLCRELVQQQTGIDMSGCEMAAWVVSATWQKTIAPKLTVQQCLDAPVGATRYTKGKIWKYGEVLYHIRKMFEMWEEAAEDYGGDLHEVPLARRQEIARGLPLFGESMYNNRTGGNMCTDYCGLAKDCQLLGGGL